jgi:hypothetical protein
MYVLRTKGAKRDPIKRWGLPDRVFFACGACHVLAYAFLQRYPDSGFTATWIRPAAGFYGHHILVVRGRLAFDYHGYSDWPTLLAHMTRRAKQRCPGWNADVIDLPESVLISEPKSGTYGLALTEPGQFLFDAMPRAEQYLARFQSPTRLEDTGGIRRSPQPPA